MAENEHHCPRLDKADHRICVADHGGWEMYAGSFRFRLCDIRACPYCGVELKAQDKQKEPHNTMATKLKGLEWRQGTLSDRITNLRTDMVNVGLRQQMVEERLNALENWKANHLAGLARPDSDEMSKRINDLAERVRILVVAVRMLEGKLVKDATCKAEVDRRLDAIEESVNANQKTNVILENPPWPSLTPRQAAGNPLDSE